MRPKTKLQHEVWDLHKTLQNPQRHEAFIVAKHKFYCTMHYKKIVCLECNHSWRPEGALWHEEVVGIQCPECGKKLKKISTNPGYTSKIITYSVAEVVGRFQVFRFFSCWKRMTKKEKPIYSFCELFEEWKDWDKNKSVIIGHTSSWSGDGFSSGDYEIRANQQPVFRSSIYDSFTANYNCPKPVFLPRFDKYCIKQDYGCDFRTLLERLEKSSKVETLLKAKQKSLLFHDVHKENYKAEGYWSQIKIAIRHKYQVKDAGLWYDYIDLLRTFGKDVLNPKYILPKDLRKEHNKYSQIVANRRAKEKAIRDIQRQEEERIKAQADEALRKIKLEVFKDFGFAKNKLQVVCLINEEDVKLEGELLNHCVWTRNYHTKAGILLMSARIEGKPIETIEISLASFKIIQCRGWDNKPTEYHDEIISIVNQNMRKISKLVEKQKILMQQEAA